MEREPATTEDIAALTRFMMCYHYHAEEFDENTPFDGSLIPVLVGTLDACFAANAEHEGITYEEILARLIDLNSE